VQGFGLRIEGVKFRVQGFGFRIEGVKFRVSGVHDSGYKVFFDDINRQKC